MWRGPLVQCRMVITIAGIISVPGYDEDDVYSVFLVITLYQVRKFPFVPNLLKFVVVFFIIIIMSRC